MTDRLLDRKQLTRAFTALASKLQKQGVVGEVHICRSSNGLGL